MTNQFEKYFIEYDAKNWPIGSETQGEKMISRMDSHLIQGSHHYMIHWVMPDFPTDGPGAPPHIHKDAELLFHIGSNPDDPMDLGAEVEMCMGEGENMERYTFNRSTLVYIPAELTHCPWKPIKTIRPWIFIQVVQGTSGI